MAATLQFERGRHDEHENNGHVRTAVRPGRSRRRRRRWIRTSQKVAGLLLVAAVAVPAAFLVQRVVADGAGSVAGTVVSTGVLALNFPDMGRLTSVDVRPGQHVAAGQLLATESGSITPAQLGADQAAIAADSRTLAADSAQVGSDSAQIGADSAQIGADQARLAALQHPSLTAALSQELQLRVKEAQQALAVAQQGGNAATIQQAETNLAIADNEFAVETAPALPDVTAMAQGQLAKDRAQLAKDQAQSAKDQAQSAKDQAQSAKDQAQLSSDRIRYGAQELEAPDGGVVVAVGGRPGDVAGSDGVRQYGALGALAPVQDQPSFSLLPRGPEALPTARTSTLPLVMLKTSGAWQVIASVPEGSLGRYRPGSRVYMDVPSARLEHVAGTVLEVFPEPTAGSRTVAYQAVIATTDPGGRAAPLDGAAVEVREAK